MFKLTNSEDVVKTLSQVCVSGLESIQANTTIPRGHRLWRVYEIWLEQGNIPEPLETGVEVFNRLSFEVIEKRNKLLVESDYTVMPDYPTTKKECWKVYRQALRDITEQLGFPDNVNWPEKPE